MKQFLKQIAPRPLWNVASSAYWDWRNRQRHVWAQKAGPSWRENVRRVEGYRGKHTGERCFIVGNGPSLRRMDLGLLRDEITFGLNRVYLAFPDWGFSTTYLVSVNDLVLEQCANDMKALELPRFITWRARRWFASDPLALFLDTDFTGPENFSGEATGRLFEGFTVTYVALQLAFFMGFRQVILIGVDHNFVTQGQPNLAVVSQGDDPNHFSPQYFGAGFKWQLPDLDGSERAYLLAREAYHTAGRQVLDATVDGKLTIFPKVKYSSLFAHV